MPQRRKRATRKNDGIQYPRKPTLEQISKLHQYLERIYYDARSGGGYSTPGKLLQEVQRRGYYKKVGRRRIEHFLNRLAPYSVFRPSRGHFPTPPVVVNGPLHQFDIDLVDVSRQQSANDGVRYLVTAIDVFSKYAIVVPVVSKNGSVVANAVSKIIDIRLPRAICSDLGSEFRSGHFQKLLRDRNIHHFYAGGSGKCTIVERFHRTLKTRIARFEHHQNTERYIDALQDIVEGYNKSYHRTIKGRPIDVTEAEKDVVFFNSYAKKQPAKLVPFRFEIGDNVRISAERHPFLREHFQRWSEELYTVTKRWRQRNINMYKVKDCSEDEVIGSFYADELTKVEGANDSLYRIEKVLDEKMENGVRMIKVKFVGYPERCGKWIHKRDVRTVR